MNGLTLATNSAGFEQRVRRAFAGSLNGELRRWRDDIGADELRSAVADLTADGVDVVAVGPDVPLQQALRLAREVDETRPEISVILVTKPGAEVWEAALRAGVRDVLPTDASDDELRVTIQRALQIADRRRRNLTEAGDGAATAGRVLTVVAPKGGSGKTAIATNLGVGLARAVQGKVALVDLDLQFGDITPTLDLEPEHSIADFMRSGGPSDITALKVFLTKRKSSLFVLCAPDSPEDGEQVNESMVHRTVDLLAHEFQYVIVDTAAGLTEYTLAAVELATDLILVCDMSTAAVRGMAKVVSSLNRLELTQATRHFVLNRADSRVGLDLSQVVSTVGMPIDVKLPSSKAVPMSMNQGTPLVETAPRSSYARRVDELVKRLADVPSPPSLWRRKA